MSGSSNIKQWNPGANNQATDAEYLLDTLRTGGAPLGSLFPSKTGNKLFYQLTTMAAALAQALADKGYEVSDEDLAALTAVMANIRTRDVGIRDSFRNLVVVNNSTHPTYQVDLTCDEAILQDSDGNAVRISDVSVTYDVTAGLDGGTETTSAWYHLWLFAKSDGSYTHKLSLSATTPTAPSGYDFKAYAGAVYNDSSGNFRTFYQRGNRATWAGLYRDLNAGTQSTFTSISLSIPPTARIWHGNIAVYAASAVGSVHIAADIYSLSDAAQVGWASAGAASQGSHSMLIKTAQTMYYRIEPGSPYGTTSAHVWTSAWEY